VSTRAVSTTRMSLSNKFQLKFKRHWTTRSLYYFDKHVLLIIYPYDCNLSGHHVISKLEHSGYLRTIVDFMCLFCTGHFVILSFNLTCLICLHKFVFEHLFNDSGCRAVILFMPPPFEEWWRGIKCYPCLCVRLSVHYQNLVSAQ